MKKKLEEEPKSVAAYVQPGAGLTPEGQEELREQTKLAEDKARIDALKQRNRNRVAELLEAKVFIREWTHPCLMHPEIHRQTSVSEFYPELNIAVDKFFHFDQWELRLTDFKRKALNDAGFKYVLLTPDKDWGDAAADLESQKVAIA